MLAKPICLYVWKYEERCTVPKLLPSSLVTVGCSLPYTSYTGRKCRHHTEDGFEIYSHFDRFLCGFDQLLSRDLWQRHGGYYTLTHMIFCENPSIHQLTHSPYCFDLSNESICQRKSKPLLWYCFLLRRLLNLSSTPFGSKTHGVPRNRHSSL